MTSGVGVMPEILHDGGEEPGWYAADRGPAPLRLSWRDVLHGRPVHGGIPEASSLAVIHLLPVASFLRCGICLVGSRARKFSDAFTVLKLFIPKIENSRFSHFHGLESKSHFIEV